MELNIREEKLRNLFKQFQVEHNENCETVFIDNNDEHLENYSNEPNEWGATCRIQFALYSIQWR